MLPVRLSLTRGGATAEGNSINLHPMSSFASYSTEQLTYLHAKVYLAAVELAQKVAKKRVALAKKLARQAPRAKRAQQLHQQLEMAQQMLAGLQVSAASADLVHRALEQVQQCQHNYQQWVAAHKLMPPEEVYLAELGIRELAEQQAMRQQEARNIHAVLVGRY